MSAELRGGVDRSHGSSGPQKLVFYGLHTVALGLCGWIVLGDGLETVGGWFGRTWHVAVPTRAWLILGVAALYWARHALTMFYIMDRKVAWAEGLPLGIFMLVLEAGYCLLGTGALSDDPPPVGWIDYLAVGLVLVGSYFTSGSELQRKWWKANPENKGHCYTEGLFGLSMHVNYFGDVVSFTGWSMLTATAWTAVLPVAMLGMFVGYHIPHLDAYLAERYGEEFERYAAKTKKLIPFIY